MDEFLNSIIFLPNPDMNGMSHHLVGGATVMWWQGGIDPHTHLTYKITIYSQIGEIFGTGGNVYSDAPLTEKPLLTFIHT